MSNYPSQDHPSQQQPWSGRSRDEQFGRGYRDPYRDQEFGGQRRPWQESQSNRSGVDSAYGDTDRDFYEQNPVSSNYGAYRGRSQHRNEPWPRNEDRENYSAAGSYSSNDYSPAGGRRDFFEEGNQPSTGRYHGGGQDYGRGYGQSAQRYGQSYGGPGANYGQMQESARWREQQQGFRGYQGDQQQGNFYHQGNYGSQGYGSQSYGSQGSPQREIPQPGYFQAGDFSHQRGYTSSEYPEDTGYLYSAHPYSQGNQQMGRSLGTQNWQEREGAQRGAFGLQSTHRGRGPQGYTRSDERIKEDVCERLSEHHYIDASQIRVEVNQGVVTLEGTVDDRWQKYQTEDLVDSLSGVKDIQNRLNVSRASRESAQWTSQHAAGQTASSQQGSDANAGKRNIADKSGDQTRGKPGGTTTN